ncbi:MAG: lysophospholipase, partial [Thermomicrobium sp.]|nr:lysophospholipase [Thermomicrobium sp.]
WGLPILERISDGPRPFAGLNPEDPDVRRALSGWNAALDVGDPVIVEELRSLRFPWRILRELDRTARAAFSAATRVRCPVWLVHARADQTVPVSDSRRLAARLPMLQGYFEPPGDHQLVRPEHPGYWLVSQLLVRLGSER